jgi:hypothetical protein
MRRTILFLVFALIAMSVIATPLQAHLGCKYWYCYVGESTASCSEVYCPQSGCNPPYPMWSMGCVGVCDGPGCWCRYDGECYEV